jgi:O-antigen/teichoic acid export membrane protein
VGTDPSSAPRRQLAGGALASLAGQVALLASNGLLSIVVARAVGASGTGRFGLAVTVFSIAVPVSHIGLKSGITYLVSRGEWPARRALWESQCAALLLALLAASVVFAIHAVWPDGPLQGLSTGMLALTMVSTGLAIAWSYSAGIVLAVEGYEVFGLSMIVQAAVTLVLGVVLTVTSGVIGALAALAAGQLLAAVLTAAGVLRRAAAVGQAGGGAVAGGDLRELRRAAAFGSRTWLGEMFWGLNFRLDIVILNVYVAASTVGPYFVAGQLMTLAWLLPGALQNVVVPRVAALDAAAGTAPGAAPGTEAVPGSDPTVARSMRHAVLLTLPAAAGLAILLAAGVPLLFGDEFSDAVAYGFILLPGVLAAGVGKVAAAAVTGRGRPELALIPMLIATPVTVALYLIVIPGAGASGAAIVSSASYAASALLTVVLLARATGIPLRAMLVPRSGDLADYRQLLRSMRQYAADVASAR